MRVAVGAGIALAIAGAGLFALVTPTGDAHVEAAPSVVVASADGREVAVVAYETSGGRGAVPIPFAPMFTTRLAALDLATGETVWDVRLDEELLSDAQVLAADGGLVYVATNDGLHVRSLDDGAQVGDPAAIEGLGDARVTASGAYLADHARQAIVTIDLTGRILLVPFGTATAVAADAEAEARWRDVLAHDSRFAPDPPTTAGTALLPGADPSGGASVALQPLAVGARQESLVVTTGGPATPLGDTRFVDAGIVVRSAPQTVVTVTATDVICESMPADCDPAHLPQEVIDAMGAAGQVTVTIPAYAAGADDGFVLVSHAADQDGSSGAVSTVDLATGAVIATVDVGSEVGGAWSSGGRTVLVSTDYGLHEPELLVVADADGVLRTFEIGRTNLFGVPI